MAKRGRPREIDWDEVWRLHDDGLSYKQIAAELGCTKAAIFAIINADRLREQRIARKPPPVEGWSKLECEIVLREAYLWYGRLPTFPELGHDGLPSRRTLENLYGSVKEAFEAAGLPTREPGQRTDSPI